MPDEASGKDDLKKKETEKARDPSPSKTLPALPKDFSVGPVRPTSASAAPFFAKISRSVEQRWVQFFILLPLLSFIALGLNYGTRGTCFPFIIVPLVVLVIPFYFGIKKAKALLVLGMLTLLVSGIMWGVVDAHCFQGRTCGYERGFVDSEDYQGRPAGEKLMSFGTVDPLQSDPGSFNFTVIVNLTRAEAQNRNVTEVRAVTIDYAQVIWGASGESLNLTMTMWDSSNSNSTRWYGVSTISTASIYLTYFAVHSVNGTQNYWDYTYVFVGPVTASILDAYAKFIPNRMVVSVGVFGIMLLFMLSILWWSRKAKEKRVQMEEQLHELEKREAAKPKPEGKKSDFACTACGAGVSESDNKCPACGAVFEEDEPKKDVVKDGPASTSAGGARTIQPKPEVIEKGSDGAGGGADSPGQKAAAGASPPAKSSQSSTDKSTGSPPQWKG